MTRQSANDPGRPAAAAAPVEERSARRELLPLVIAAILLAFPCRGHFVKPHGDFYEFRETGRALLRGELPPTFKRAPVYPLLVALGGTAAAAAGATEIPPDQLAAEWLNAVLLPCNVVLVYLIGRRWFGSGARWAALWTALLPVGLYCTAHVLVEPALLATVLLTVWLAQRGSRWAYAAAALALMTRYDAAGVLPWLVVADVRRGVRVRQALARGALALVPLSVWLVLTALTWETRSADHYLRQIGEQRTLDVLWPLEASLSVVFGPDALAVPVWAAECEPWLRAAVRVAIVVSALVGAVALLLRRDPGVLAALGFLVGYWGVHAAFPFRFFRFGYPPAPLVLLLAGSGGQLVAGWLRPLAARRLVAGAALIGLTFPLLMLAYEEAFRLRLLLAVRQEWLTMLPAAGLLGTGLVWGGAVVGRQRSGPRLLGGLALCVLALVQMRLALPLLGSGRERINDVWAARWVRDHVAPHEGVLTDSPGLLRLYAGDEPAGRFVGLGQIAAESWPEILAECRGRGIRYIIWHTEVFSEQGAYYIRKWGLERFQVLAEPEQVAGLSVVVRYEGDPTLWVLRIDGD